MPITNIELQKLKAFPATVCAFLLQRRVALEAFNNRTHPKNRLSELIATITGFTATLVGNVRSFDAGMEPYENYTAQLVDLVESKSRQQRTEEQNAVNNDEHVQHAGNASTQLLDIRLQTLYQEQLSAIVPLQLGMAAIARNFDASLQSLGTLDAILDGVAVVIALVKLVQRVMVNVTLFARKLRTLLEEIDMAAAQVSSRESWELRLERFRNEMGAVE
jgi:hypothetical protein